MVKSVLGVKHQGLHDWVIQRLSAIFMAIYFIGLIVYLVRNPDLSFAEWHTLFAQTWFKVATVMLVVSLLLHAWVGVWTIVTDYVGPTVLRCIVHVLVLLTLVASFIWTIIVLWSV